MPDYYLTVEKDAVYELVEKKSKFIAYVKPIISEKDALSFVNNIKSKHWNARHNVYAYVVNENNISRYSDDGEPHGTAGLPVLDVIKKNDLKDIAVVVTRYFGGILLGTGGLVRAYSQATTMALNCAKIIKMYLCYDCNVFCDYNQYGRLLGIINECGGVVDDSIFSQRISVFFHLKKENFLSLSKKVMEFSSGTLCCNILSENFYGL